jgi:NAD(P)-dependent dehydrogenase (short-subunit alcohol dehydrogenase family)
MYVCRKRSARPIASGAPRLSTYSASKFAVRGLTQAAGACSSEPRKMTMHTDRHLAQDLGAYGITVNAYAPG